MAPRRDRRNPSTDQKKARNMQRRKTSSVPTLPVFRTFHYDGTSYFSLGEGSPVEYWTNDGQWAQIDEAEYSNALEKRRTQVGDVSRTNEFTGTKESIVSQHNWMMAEATADKAEVEAKMRAEAAIFYRRLAQMVKEHPEEIVRQATDRASLAATQYAPFQREAKVAYFDAVTHHAKVDGIKVAFEVEAEAGSFTCTKCGMTADTDDLSVIGRNCSATDFEGAHEMVPTAKTAVVEAGRHGDYDSFYGKPGYVCKICGTPSPLGVGYADNSEGAFEKSEDISTCKCGYSVKGGVEVVGSVKTAGESVEVSTIPDCDICKSEGTTTPAYADARLAALGGMWGNVCQMHFDALGCSLGTGSGQAYVKTAAAPGEDPNFDATMYEWGYEVGQRIRNGEDVPNGGVASGQEDSDLPFPSGVRDGKAGNPKAMTAKASIKTSARIDTLRDIVDSHRGGKAPQSDQVDGVPVDPQTANMLVTLYDALGEGAKAKFDQIELMKLINFGWSKVSSAKTAEWGERNFGRSLFDEDDYNEAPTDSNVEQIARDILAENGEPNPHPALLADTISEVEYQMQNNAAFRTLAQASLKEADVPAYVKDLDGDEAYEVGREDGKDAEKTSEPYADGFADEVEGKPNDAEYWRNHGSRKESSEDSNFIGFANDEDNFGTLLDPFLDWVDDDGEFMAGDMVSKETYDRKRREYDAQKGTTASRKHADVFVPTHTYDGIPVRLVAVGGSVVPSALIEFEDGTSDWAPPADLIPLGAQSV